MTQRSDTKKLASGKARPKEIRCRDERTYALLKDFCEKTGIRIGIYKGELPALDEAEESGIKITYCNPSGCLLHCYSFSIFR